MPEDEKQQPGVFAKRVAELGRENEALKAQVKMVRRAVILLGVVLQDREILTLGPATELERILKGDI